MVLILPKKVIENSKEIQGALKLTTEETASITAGLGLIQPLTAPENSEKNRCKEYNSFNYYCHDSSQEL